MNRTKYTTAKILKTDTMANWRLYMCQNWKHTCEWNLCSHASCLGLLQQQTFCNNGPHFM